MDNKKGVFAVGLSEKARKNKIAYTNKWKKETQKRIPLDVPQKKYAEIKETAEKINLPVNTFIKQAIDEKIQKVNSASVPGIVPTVPASVPASASDRTETETKTDGKTGKK